MKKLVYLMLVVALSIFMATSAFAESLPSSKAAVALGDLIDLGALASTDNSSTEDTGFVTVMQTFIKTPNQKELSFDVALQCALVTDTTVRSKAGIVDTAEAKGTISVRVKVTDEAGNVGYALPSEEGTLTDGSPVGVRYCERLQLLSANFAGLNCTSDLTTGVVTCLYPEELRLLLETLDAHSFNFLLADVVPGVQKVEVQARAVASAGISGSSLGDAEAHAFIGLGSTRVETIRLIKDADLGPIVLE